MLSRPLPPWSTGRRQALLSVNDRPVRESSLLLLASGCGASVAVRQARTRRVGKRGIVLVDESRGDDRARALVAGDVQDRGGDHVTDLALGLSAVGGRQAEWWRVLARDQSSFALTGGERAKRRRRRRRRRRRHTRGNRRCRAWCQSARSSSAPSAPGCRPAGRCRARGSPRASSTARPASARPPSPPASGGKASGFRRTPLLRRSGV